MVRKPLCTDNWRMRLLPPKFCTIFTRPSFLVYVYHTESLGRKLTNLTWSDFIAPSSPNTEMERALGRNPTCSSLHKPLPYVPRSTDAKNSGSGTPRSGEAMLSSQLGDIGKRRREIMARRRLGWSPASCEEEGRGRPWITTV